MTWRVIWGVVGVLAGMVGMARAETAPAELEEAKQAALLLAEQPGKEQEAFSKGSWALELWGSYINSQGISDDEATGGTGNLGVGYYFADRLGIYAELGGYALSEDRFEEESDVAGGGFSLLLRWHFLKVDRFSFYIDGGSGVVELDEDFPRPGSRFNFVERVGLGATCQLVDHLHLMGGARWFHLSNADLYGADRNPGVDALEYYAGLIFTF